MLETIEDYIYIDDNILYKSSTDSQGEETKEPRATIDTDVLGIREEVRLPRLVDYYYLNELSAIHSNSLSNSVTFKWPVPFKTKFPQPDLSKFADVDKLEEIDTDVYDICEMNGGEYPDYWECVEEERDADDLYYKKLERAKEDYDKEIDIIKAEYDTNIDELNDERE